MIYLNNSATSFPKPPQVIDAVYDCLNNPVVHASRTGHNEPENDRVLQCRISLSRLLNNSKPENVIFTSGSTESLNLAIRGCGIDNSHVVSTVIEHNSVLRPLKKLESDGLIDLDLVNCNSSGLVDPDDIRSALKPSTKAVVINHCSNVNGAIQDISTISKIAHNNGAIIIADASQSAGAVPIDFDGWEIDLLSVTAHKSLYGIQGTGALLVKEGLLLKPLIFGGTGVFSHLLTQPPGFPIHYEAGTLNTPGIVALGSGIDWIIETGFDKIINRKKELFTKIYDALNGIEAIKCYNPASNHSYSNFSFNVDGLVPEEVGYMLESSFGILVRSGLHCAPLMLEPMGVAPWGTVRASHSFFTTDSEADSFIEAIRQIASFRKNGNRL
jgi:cysteine desulfurase family protein